MYTSNVSGKLGKIIETVFLSYPLEYQEKIEKDCHYANMGGSYKENKEAQRPTDMHQYKHEEHVATLYAHCTHNIDLTLQCVLTQTI